jgi:zinc transport system permease protein
MRTVGLLLVSALMVIPVAAARNLVRGFTSGLVCAVAIGVITAVGGAALLPDSMDDDELVAPHTVTESHPHRHEPGCGHPAVQHGDHTDFIHEGHRHAVHADHYDEH